MSGTNLLGRFEESIASLMPAHEAAAYRARLSTQREAEARAEATMRAECCEVITYCVQAISTPNICRADLERALTHLSKALVAANVIDPEDAE